MSWVSVCESLAREPKNTYVPPVIPTPEAEQEEGSLEQLQKEQRSKLQGSISVTPFGKAFKEEHFHIKKSCLYMNHGSYGATPKFITLIQSKWRLLLV